MRVVGWRRVASTLSPSPPAPQSQAGGDAARWARMYEVVRRRGLVLPNSEVYGGLASALDFGPLGAQLKKNLRDRWWRDFVERRRNCMGLESSVLMNRAVWEAAGHLSSFTDPLVECKLCHARFRADHLEQGSGGQGYMCPCPQKNTDFSEPKEFNMLFQTRYGCTEDSPMIPLRPETAQGIFTQFPAIVRNHRPRLPFGVGQVGKSFRNEISPGHMLFRMREFEQMELEFFCKPEEATHWYQYWVQESLQWLLDLGIPSEMLRCEEAVGEEAAHYAACSTDIEFLFSFGWGELWGIANRTDFDLRAHMLASGKDFSMRELQESGSTHTLPYCIEPALGLDRLMLALLSATYTEEEVLSADGQPTTRSLFRLPVDLAPIQMAVLPLSKKEPLVSIADSFADRLCSQIRCEVDVTQSIGKRYRRQDEVGTPFCVTVDFETPHDGCVTIRYRDSMFQVRMPMDQVVDIVSDSNATLWDFQGPQSTECSTG